MPVTSLIKILQPRSLEILILSRHEAQGTYPSFISYSMAVRKQLWNKKASIALTANNIFSKYINQES